jgi:hypothetical protein
MQWRKGQHFPLSIAPTAMADTSIPLFLPTRSASSHIHALYDLTILTFLQMDKAKGIARM